MCMVQDSTNVIHGQLGASFLRGPHCSKTHDRAGSVAQARPCQSRTVPMKPTSAVIVCLFITTTISGQPAATVPIDSDDIGGVVSGPAGPEAGVWVVAETT